MTISNTFFALPAAHLRVTEGANIGDGMDAFTTAVPEDRYRFIGPANALYLTIQAPADQHLQLVARDSMDGRQTPVSLIWVATFMSMKDASVIECVVVSGRRDNSAATARWLIPTGTFDAEIEYSLTDLVADTARANRLMAQIVSASFVSGTRLMCGNRSFVPVENLKPGDTLFTRDNGMQTIRWIGKRTLRAEGQFAPVTIAANSLGAHATVRLSPTHRLLTVHRSSTELGAPSHQLVAARNLIDGINVTQSTGGFVDYHQVVLDNHEILFAEGVAVESQMPLSTFDTREHGTTDRSARRRLQRQHDYAQAITRDLTDNRAKTPG